MVRFVFCVTVYLVVKLGLRWLGGWSFFYVDGGVGWGCTERRVFPDLLSNHYILLYFIYMPMVPGDDERSLCGPA